MNRKISIICLAYLHNEEHFGFHSEFKELLEAYALNETFRELADIYSVRFVELEAGLETVRRSVYTEQLTAANAQRQRNYRGLRFAVKGYLLHSDAEKRQAAKRLYNIMQQYKAATRGANEDRMSAISSMLQNLKKELVVDSGLTGVSGWVSELESSNKACLSTKELRYTEWEKRPLRKIKAARLALDDAYKALVMYLEAYGRLNGTGEEYRNLIIALNERIGFFRRLIAQRRGLFASRKISASLEEKQKMTEQEPTVM